MSAAKYPRRTIALGPPFDDGTVPVKERPADASGMTPTIQRALAVDQSSYARSSNKPSRQYSGRVVCGPCLCQGCRRLVTWNGSYWVDGDEQHVCPPPCRIPVSNGAEIVYALVDAEFVGLSDLAWYLTRKGYVRHDGVAPQRAVLMHRVVLGLETGNGLQADHINRNKLDNRRANLRIATAPQNAQNRPAQAGSSRFRGVSWDKSRNRWMARAVLDGKTHTIGRFATEDEAGRAASKFRLAHMPYAVD